MSTSTHDSSDNDVTSVSTPPEGEKKTPSLLLASIPVLTLIILLGGGYIFAELPVEPLLIASAVVAGIVAWTLGYSWNEIIESVAQKIAKTMPAILILITVGMLIGSWMAGGTIPMLIYYGLKIINPAYLALIALVVTAIVSLFTGTSWGSAGTIGVAFMGVAVGMDANLPMVAGAVVAGAYFGDKLSPLSDTTNIAAVATGVNLFDHVRHMLWTTVPAFLISGTVYLIFGLNSSGGEVPEKVGVIMKTLESAFSWNIMLIVPVLIVLGGSMWRKPTIPVMLLSSVVAMFNAVVFQGISFKDTVISTVNGFNVEMVTAPGFDAENVLEDVTKLLNRGGMNSMMSVLLICFCAITFAGVVSVSGSLDVLISRLLLGVKSTFALIASTVITGMATIGITSNGQVSILIPGEMLRPAYIRRGLHPKNLSRTIEDSVTVIEPILPWTSAGAYMAGTLGVATISYLPWAISNWIAIFIALIWGATGIGIAKLSAEEQEEFDATL
ncbi:MAG: Na+/H+ antiporter NhaC [Actinobacteria bacterium]|nr:MAG: Na+/H+ antiporter NhaC [Actinomycetota bacterium]